MTRQADFFLLCQYVQASYTILHGFVQQTPICADYTTKKVICILFCFSTWIMFAVSWFMLRCDLGDTSKSLPLTWRFSSVLFTWRRQTTACSHSLSHQKHHHLPEMRVLSSLHWEIKAVICTSLYSFCRKIQGVVHTHLCVHFAVFFFLLLFWLYFVQWWKVEMENHVLD